MNANDKNNNNAPEILTRVCLTDTLRNIQKKQNVMISGNVANYNTIRVTANRLKKEGFCFTIHKLESSTFIKRIK